MQPPKQEQAEKPQQQQAEQPQKKHHHKKGKGPAFSFEFSKTDDKFITEMGRKYRNKQKKMDKIKETEQKIKKGEIKEPTDT